MRMIIVYALLATAAVVSSQLVVSTTLGAFGTVEIFSSLADLLRGG